MKDRFILGEAYVARTIDGDEVIFFPNDPNEITKSVALIISEHNEFIEDLDWSLIDTDIDIIPATVEERRLMLAHVRESGYEIVTEFLRVPPYVRKIY